MARKVGILTFGVSGIITALSLITSIILARSLGQEGRGVLLILIFWPALLRGLLYFSLNEGTNYAVARSCAEGASDEIDQTSRAALSLNLLAILIVTGLSLIALPFLLGQDRQAHLQLLLLFTAAATPFTLLDLYYSAVCQGRNRVTAYNLLRFCQPGIYAITLLALWVSGQVSVEYVLIAMVASTAGSVALGMIYEGLAWPALDGPRMRAIFGASAQIHGANVLFAIATEIDKLVVVQFTGEAAVGIYAVAVAVSALGSAVVVQSFAILAYPMISGAANRQVQRNLIQDFAQLSFLLLLFINGTAAVLSPWLVPLIFGQAFSAAVPVVIILLVMNILKGMRQVIDRGLRALLDIRPCMIAEAVSLVTFVTLVALGFVWAEPRDRLVGIAISLTLSQFLALAVIIGFMRRNHELSLGNLFGVRGSTALRLAREAWRHRR